MTKETLKKAQELFEDLGVLESDILRMKDWIDVFKKRGTGNFALRDTADLTSPIINISQEEALPFFEKYLAKMEAKFKEMEDEFARL